MTRDNDFILPVDIVFDGQEFFDFEYPYKKLGAKLAKDDPLLKLTDCFSARPDCKEKSSSFSKPDCSFKFGGSSSNGAMGFLLLLDQSGKVRWYLALGDSNPVESVIFDRELIGTTSSGMQIKVSDPFSPRVCFSFLTP